MKSIHLFIAFAILSFFSSNAQITKKNWLVGGTGNFYSSQLKSENSTQNGIGLELRPSVGLFVIDKFAVGLTPLLAYNKPENGNSITSYGIGPFARYYFLKPENRINILSHIGYTYYGNSNANDNSTALDFRTGAVLFFNSSVALELTLNYNINNIQSTTKYNIFSLGLGFQIHIEK